jgi:hypothetical protein
MGFWSNLFSGAGSTLGAAVLAGLVAEAKAEIDKGKLKAAEKAIAKAGVDLLAARVAAKLVK